MAEADFENDKTAKVIANIEARIRIIKGPFPKAQQHETQPIPCSQISRVFSNNIC